MSRLALFAALAALVAVVNACAAPTAPNTRTPSRTAQEDTGAFCGWVVPNGRC